MFNIQCPTPKCFVVSPWKLDIDHWILDILVLAAASPTRTFQRAGCLLLVKRWVPALAAGDSRASCRRDSGNLSRIHACSVCSFPEVDVTFILHAWSRSSYQHCEYCPAAESSRAGKIQPSAGCCWPTDVANTGRHSE
jgi:hypothetical protein